MDINGIITFADEYQDLTKETEIYTAASEDFLDQIVHLAPDLDDNKLLQMRHWLSLSYCTGKLNGESGELAELVFKAFRGTQGVLTEEQRLLAMHEIGDVLWYVARIADLLGYKLSDIMTYNIKKLQDRKERGMLHGYGDNR